MSNKYIENKNGDFKSDLKIAEEAELLFCHLAKKSKMLSSIIHTPIQYWFDKFGVNKTSDLPVECDFLFDSGDNDWRGIEVKSLAGNYSTLVIEKWSDDNMTKRPGWIKSTEYGILKYVIFYRRHEDAFYLFDAQSLYEYIENCEELTRAKNGNSCDSGWICKVKWENEDAGFLRKFR